MFKLLLANLKMLIRNRQALFWSLAFPLMFTVIFGFFFSGGAGSAGTVAFINKSDSQLATTLDEAFQKFDLAKYQKETDLDHAKDLLNKAKVNVVVYIPADFGAAKPDAPTQLQVYFDPGNAQSNATVTGFLNHFLTEANYQIQGAKPIFSIDARQTTTNSFNYFDFVLVGLLGMALMNSNIQGLAITMSKYREDKILKRITTTPLPAWQFVVAEVLSRIVVNFVQVSLILAVGALGFHGHIYGNVWILYLLALLGAILFQLIGFAIAAATKSTDAAEGMATAVAIPMMFLAGVFFPIDQLPKWLTYFVDILPLAPLLRMLRTVGLESSSAFTNPYNMVIVLAWIVVLLGFTAWRFRLSEE